MIALFMEKGVANQAVIPAQAGIQSHGRNRPHSHSNLSQLKP